jgi:hypothetical protein
VYPISVGKNCTTAFQIKRYLRKLDPGSDVSRQFFDWLGRGEALGVAELLRNKLNLDRANFYAFEKKPGIFVPRDSLSGMSFLHDFQGGGYFATERECLFAITKEWKDFSEKYERLKKRFYHYTFEKKDIAFIYYGKMSNFDLNSLKTAILETFQKEVPVMNFLDKVDFDVSSKSNGQILIVNKKPQDPSVPLWKGDDVSWDSAFGIINSNMKNDYHST